MLHDWMIHLISWMTEWLLSYLEWLLSYLEWLIDWLLISSIEVSVIDANFGEIIPTCEKLIWTMTHGEDCLKTEHRQSGRISMLQSARVEYHPIGVMGAIVSWNYPFHNVMGPIISAIMAGNGCVVKVIIHTL